MRSSKPQIRLAIVGQGPRGLGALEALMVASSGSDVSVKIDAFDPFEHAGAGPNFSPDSAPHCILNIPTRGVGLSPSAKLGVSIGTFEAWLPESADREKFPPRFQLGNYLTDRLSRVIDSLPPKMELHRSENRIIAVKADHQGWWLNSHAQVHGPYDEVLLTQGQPATRPDPQLEKWISHAAQSEATLQPAYPDVELLEQARTWAGKSIAIRGLGLSTADVLRVLTLGLGGEFKDGRYRRSGNEPSRILPFSLDGQPPAPKPLNAELDRKFDPTPSETAAFEAALANALTGSAERAFELIFAVMREPVQRIISAMDADATLDDIDSWLKTERDNPGAQETRAPVDALRANIKVATGDKPPTVGYAIGQLWRKWQNELRSAFNTARPSTDTLTAIISFDESLKRFSYGPPLRAAQELLLLIEADLVTLKVADDPDIALIPSGWRLRENDKSSEVDVIVDAVLPSPSLEKISEPLFASMVAQEMICTIADGLGVLTQPDGSLTGPNGSVQHGLCLLGRMALGSVIAVDSIHDCFGASADRWAYGLIARASK